MAGIAAAVLAIGCSSEGEDQAGGSGAAAGQGGSAGKGGGQGASDGLGAAGGAGGGAGAQGVTRPPEGELYDTLAEWHLFSDPVAQTPNEGVIPYTVASPLFSDFAKKWRFMAVPEGEQIVYDPASRWGFPVGTILVKTFSYPEDLREPDGPERLLETRLLIRESEGWVPVTYVWDEDQTEAIKKVAGATLDTSFVGEDGEPVQHAYVIPNTNECRECHGEDPNTIGGTTRQLNVVFDQGAGAQNQIDHLAALGLLDTDPGSAAERQLLVDPLGDAPLDERFRAYVDANCGHCHAPGDTADSGSGLWLDYASTDPATRRDGTLGICKIPTSAGGGRCGRIFDIVPGAPDESILMCRLESIEAEVAMPPLGRTLVHTAGVGMVREWILGLEGTCATATP